jgi:YebC/PmpR family DNA-binding regulatory protein
MSGHSKWANIKHRKGAADARKGRVFSRLAKEIMLAARAGGSDVSANTRLRTALATARTANMPKDNIERAIKKGTGEIAGVQIEELVYEGYGAGGAAILVECATDNRNRTAGEVRMLFDRGNGSLAGTGAVTWMFKRKARLVVSGPAADENRLMELLIEAGVEDIDVEDGVAEIWGPPDSLEALGAALAAAGIEPDESGLVQRPDNTVEVNDRDTARQLLRLVEKLEDHDDVQAVHANFDIAPAILQELGEDA